MRFLKGNYNSFIALFLFILHEEIVNAVKKNWQSSSKAWKTQDHLIIHQT